MNKDIFSFVNFIKSKDGIGNKSGLIEEVQKKFRLTKVQDTRDKRTESRVVFFKICVGSNASAVKSGALSRSVKQCAVNETVI